MTQTRRLAFTLVEMLTVIAITAVLMTIIVYPVFQSFNLTRAGQAFADAQNQARSISERISREISGAVTVRGFGSTVQTTLNGNAVKLPSNSLIVQVPGRAQIAGNPQPVVDVALPWTKLDVIPPAQFGPSTPSSFIDPVSGKQDPTLKTFKGQMQTPSLPGSTLVRYSLGLRDPANPYNEPYTGILEAQGGGRDNLVVLRRSTCTPYVMSATGPIVNTALFAVNPDTNGPAYDDPRFLVLDRDNAGVILQDSHNVRVYHWMGTQPTWETSVDGGDTIEHSATNMAHSVIETQVTRYDMIMPQYNLVTRLPAYDGQIPRLTPLIQFKPTVVANDPAAGQEALRQGEETDNGSAIAPDIFKTQYGLWNNAVIRSYPPGFLNSVLATNKYNVGYVTATGAAPGFSVYAYDPAAGGTEFTTGTETFSVYEYDNAAGMLGSATPGTPIYPFTAAALAANSRSAWLTQPVAKQIFTPYDVLGTTGKIRASFDISEVGLNSLPNVSFQDVNRPNLPTLDIVNAPVSPLQDVINSTAVYSGTGYDINSAFNRAWNQHTYLQPNIQRFIDLRVTPNEDGTLSPLYPLNIAGQVVGFQQTQPDGSTINRARIVPGSDTLIGPDQLPGDHFGHPIAYTRVTQNPGPNQYRINYVDLPEPSVATATPGLSAVTPEAYESIGLTASDVSGFNVDTYDSTNFVSATIQPRYKGGYIQLNSDPNIPMPQGYEQGGNLIPVPFKVDYRFQFTSVLPGKNVQPGAGRADSFAVDYDTLQLMQVLLTVRNIGQTSLPNPQTVTLKATAALRNFTR